MNIYYFSTLDLEYYSEKVALLVFSNNQTNTKISVKKKNIFFHYLNVIRASTHRTQIRVFV